MHIDLSKTINQLIEEGNAVVIFDSITLLTDEQLPKYIPAVDVNVFHKDLIEIRHDAKPFKNATSYDNISQSQTVADQTLSNAAKNIILQAIMSFLSTQ